MLKGVNCKSYLQGLCLLRKLFTYVYKFSPILIILVIVDFCYSYKISNVSRQIFGLDQQVEISMMALDDIEIDFFTYRSL